MKKFTAKILVVLLLLSCFYFIQNDETAKAYYGWVGADNSPYLPQAITQPLDINVSRNIGESAPSNIKVDSKGVVHMVWRDDTPDPAPAPINHDVFYAKWDNTRKLWVGAAGSVYDPTLAIQPWDINVSRSTLDFNGTWEELWFDLDSNDQPHIVWNEIIPGGNQETFYLRWSPTANNWVGAGGSNYVPNVPQPTDINVSRSNGNSWQPKVVIDKNNTPNLAWLEGGDVYYVRWNNTINNWVGILNNPYIPNVAQPIDINVSRTAGGSGSPRLAIDSNLTPHLAWADWTWPGGGSTYRSYYVRWNAGLGGWVGGNGLGYNNATGANGRLGPVLMDNWPLDLVVDTQNNAHVIMDVAPTWDVWYVRWNPNSPPNGNWVGANNSVYNSATLLQPFDINVSRNPMDADFTDLDLDSNDQPHLLMSSQGVGTNYEVLYLHWDDALDNWYGADGSLYNPVASIYPADINASRNFGSGLRWKPRFDLDENDIPHCTWSDRNFGGNTEIIYVKWMGVFEGKFTIKKSSNIKTVAEPGKNIDYTINWRFDNPMHDPLDDPYLVDQIPSNTKYAGGFANFVDDMSYSNDQGLTWLPGEAPTGSPSGTQIRWMIQPEWVGANSKIYNPATGEHGNVSRNTTGSGTTNFALDSNNNPHVVWTNQVPGNSDIFYIYWDSEDKRWETIDGEEYTSVNGAVNISRNSGSSLSPKIRIDINDVVHIAWNDETYDSLGRADVLYIRWDDKLEDWVGANGSVYNPISTPQPADINVSRTVNTLTQSAQLEIDGQGRPHVAWSEFGWGTQPEVAYVRWDGTSWVGANGILYDPITGANANVSRTPNVYSFTNSRFFIENDGTVYLTWTEQVGATTDIYFVMWNPTLGNWVGANGTTIYVPGAVQPLQVNVSRNTGNSLNASLFVDSRNDPHIVWADSTWTANSETTYVKWDGRVNNWVGIGFSIYNPGAAVQPLDINVSRSAGGTSMPPIIVVDQFYVPHISWVDTTWGITDVIYVRFDIKAANWVGIARNVYNPIAAILPDDINVSRNTNMSNNVYMIIDRFNEAHISWDDITYGNAEAFYVKSDIRDREFKFSVTVDEKYNLPPVCNICWFTHRRNSSILAYSNDLCVPVGKPIMEIYKRPGSMQYFANDEIPYTVTIKNTGSLKATNVRLEDLLPNELEFVSSRPTGIISNNKVKFEIGTLGINQTVRFTIVCKVKHPERIPEKGLTSVNVATVYTYEVPPVSVNASVLLLPAGGRRELSLVVQWINVNTKKSTAKAGDEITVKYQPLGGTGPYEVTVDWGDGTKSTKIDISGDEFVAETHTYGKTGDFKVVISVIDATGRAYRLERTLKVE
jgi:uncharacterized repeat protein (TIGR01451 family)